MGQFSINIKLGGPLDTLPLGLINQGGLCQVNKAVKFGAAKWTKFEKKVYIYRKKESF